MTSSRRGAPAGPRRRSAGRTRTAGAVRPVVVRPGSLRDIRLLVDHRRRMFGSIARWAEAAMDRHDRAYRGWVRARLRSGEVRVRVAEVDGVPVASGVLWWREDQPRPGVGVARLPYIMSVYTEPAMRGRGLASRIVAELVADARAAGGTRITLHASEMGRSVYAKLGFERTWEMRRWIDPRYLRARARATARAARGGGGPRGSARARSGTGPRRPRSRRP